MTEWALDCVQCSAMISIFLFLFFILTLVLHSWNFILCNINVICQNHLYIL